MYIAKLGKGDFLGKNLDYALTGSHHAQFPGSGVWLMWL